MVLVTRIATKRSLETEDVTYHPVQPGWLRGLSRYLKFTGNIRIECVDFVPEYERDREKSQGAISWIQNLHPDIRIPKAARLISVPMANFKTGRSCCEFIPITGMAPGAFLSYQCCGEFAFQVTRYVEDGVSYVAGYCMYISEPYTGSGSFAYDHIKKCLEALPKYKPRALQSSEASFQLNHSYFLGFQEESEAIGILENLKLVFCKVLKEPVMIGADNGVIKHFKWHERYFLVSECSSCCLTILEENPPSYQSLISA